MNNNNVPSYHYFGKMTEQIICRRLRLEMNDINLDLFSPHLTDIPSCVCGYPFEIAEHFLLFCTNYQNERINTTVHLQDKY